MTSLSESLSEAIQDPWDWVAATVGGAAGCVASYFWSAFDVGTLAAGFALSAVAARKCLAVVSRGPKAKKRASALRNAVQEIDSEDGTILLAQIEGEIQLYEKGIIKPLELELKLTELTDEYRRVSNVASTRMVSVP